MSHDVAEVGAPSPPPADEEGVLTPAQAVVLRNPLVLVLGGEHRDPEQSHIYYLDSLTITDTATEGIALREKIRYWERDVFLDNSPDRVSIVQYVDMGKKKAEKNGAAVMIGHVWSAELAQTLSDLYPSLIEGGFSLSTISKVMLEEADASTGD